MNKLKKNTIIILAILMIISGVIIRILTPPGTEFIGFLTGAMFGGGAGLLVVQLFGNKNS